MKSAECRRRLSSDQQKEKARDEPGPETLFKKFPMSTLQKIEPSSKLLGILISAWRPLSKNSLRGVFSATMPSGMVFHDLMLLEKDGKRWIGFPGKPWIDQQGKTRYANFIEFRDKASANRFHDAVLAALDDYLAEAAQ